MPESNEEPKQSYPILVEVCPVCGGKERRGAEAIQQLKDEGKLHKDSFPDGLMLQVPLLDPHPPALLSQTFKVKVILAYWDVCKCGTMYCTKFDVVDTVGVAQPQPPKSPGPGGFRQLPGFLRQ